MQYKETPKQCYQLHLLSTKSVRNFIVFWGLIYIGLVIISSFGGALFSESITSSYQGKSLKLYNMEGQQQTINDENVFQSLHLRNLENEGMKNANFRFLFYKQNAKTEIYKISGTYTEFMSGCGLGVEYQPFELTRFSNLNIFPEINLNHEEIPKVMDEEGWLIVKNNEPIEIEVSCTEGSFYCHSQFLFNENLHNVGSVVFYFKFNMDQITKQFERIVLTFSFPNYQTIGFLYIFKFFFMFASAGLLLYYLIYASINDQRMSLNQDILLLLIGSILYTDPFGLISFLFDWPSFLFLSQLSQIIFYCTILNFLISSLEQSLKDLNKKKIYILPQLRFILIPVFFLVFLRKTIYETNQEKYLPTPYFDVNSDFNIYIAVYNITLACFIIYLIVLAYQFFVKKKSKYVKNTFLPLHIYSILTAIIMFISSWNQNIEDLTGVTSFSYMFSFAFLNFYVYIVSLLYCPQDQEMNDNQEILKSIYSENDVKTGEFAALTGDKEKIWQSVENDDVEDVDLDDKENGQLKRKESNSDDEENQFGEQERAMDEDIERKESDDIQEKEKEIFTLEIDKKGDNKQEQQDLL